jgi:trigger factor
MAVETSTQLKVDVQEGASWTRRLTVTVPRERVTQIRRKVASRIAGNVRLPGFRKGHMPASLVEKQFGPAIAQETLDQAIQECYREALEQGGHQPITQGQVENVHYHEGEELTFEVEFEVQPQIELGKVSGFVVPRPASEVTDADVQEVLDKLRFERASVRVVEEGAAADNDEVTVEITDLDAEAETDAAQPRPFRFVLGQRQALPDVEEAIRSLAPGAEGEFEIHYPAEFADESLAGKTQRLRIRLVELRRRDLPPLDDEFARGVDEQFESLEALRSRVHADLTVEKERGAEGELRGTLVQKIVESSPFEVPASMVERYLDAMTGQNRMDERQRARLTGEQAERISQMRAVLRPQAEAALRRLMVVEHLADREGLRATADEVDARVEKLAEEHGVSPSDAWIQLEKSGQIQSLEGEITEDKVFEFLRQQNTVA